MPEASQPTMPLAVRITPAGAGRARSPEGMTQPMEAGMQSVAGGGYLLTGLAIHAVTHPLQVPLWIDLTSVVVAALAGPGSNEPSTPDGGQ
jgi:hypothetical protein